MLRWSTRCQFSGHLFMNCLSVTQYVYWRKAEYQRAKTGHIDIYRSEEGHTSVNKPISLLCCTQGGRQFSNLTA